MSKIRNNSSLLNAEDRQKTLSFGGINIIIKSISLDELFMNDIIFDGYIKCLISLRDGNTPEETIKQIFENAPEICYELINVSTGIDKDLIKDKISLLDTLHILLLIIELSIPDAERVRQLDEKISTVSVNVLKLIDRNKDIFEKAKKSNEKEKVEDKPRFNPKDMG